MIPSPEQCLQLMDRYQMLGNIRDHSLMVGRVAELLAKSLIQAGKPISVELAVSGALLHDIAKTMSLGREDLRHDELGREICLEHGFVELAGIVAEHVRLAEGPSADCCSEKELVYYADKRVLHDRVVSLGERQDYVLARYSKGDRALHERIRQNFHQARLVEERLFALLDFGPEQLLDRLEVLYPFKAAAGS